MKFVLKSPCNYRSVKRLTALFINIEVDNDNALLPVTEKMIDI